MKDNKNISAMSDEEIAKNVILNAVKKTKEKREGKNSIFYYCILVYNTLNDMLKDEDISEKRYESILNIIEVGLNTDIYTASMKTIINILYEEEKESGEGLKEKTNLN